MNNGTADEFAKGGILTRAGTAQFRLGARDSAAPIYFDGRLDSVSVWQRLLTDSEKSTLYNSGSGLNYPLS